MITLLRVMLPDGTSEVRSVDFPRDPGYDRLAALLNEWFPKHGSGHVSVLADFNEGTNYVHLDMFVDEIGLIKGLPYNHAATALYRRAYLRDHPNVRSYKLSPIVGPAVLFNRRVWF